MVKKTLYMIYIAIIFQIDKKTITFYFKNIHIKYHKNGAEGI